MRRRCVLAVLAALPLAGGCEDTAAKLGLAPVPSASESPAVLATTAPLPAAPLPGPPTAASAAASGSTAGAAAAAPPGATPAASPGRRTTSYPESSEGLGLLSRDLLAGARGRDDATLARLLESLRLPDPATWFETTFGKVLARDLLAEYRPVRDEIGQLAVVLDRLASNGQTRLTMERFDQADQPASVGYQSAALAKMVRRTPLYSVRFASPDGKKLYHLWSFVYQAGTFRYVGKMKRIIETPIAGDRDLLELRLSDAELLRGGR
jgi:hypothetical protein